MHMKVLFTHMPLSLIIAKYFRTYRKASLIAVYTMFRPTHLRQEGTEMS